MGGSRCATLGGDRLRQKLSRRDEKCDKYVRMAWMIKVMVFMKKRTILRK